MEKRDSVQPSLSEIRPTRRGFLALTSVFASAALVGCDEQSSANSEAEAQKKDLKYRVRVPNFSKQDIKIYNGTVSIEFEMDDNLTLPRMRYAARLEGTKEVPANMFTPTELDKIRFSQYPREIIRNPIIVTGENEDPYTNGGLWIATEGLAYPWTFIMINPKDKSTAKYLTWTQSTGTKYLSLNDKNWVYNPDQGFFIPRSQIDVASKVK